MAATAALLRLTRTDSSGGPPTVTYLLAAVGQEVTLPAGVMVEVCGDRAWVM